jgi:hypothetical protein
MMCINKMEKEVLVNMLKKINLVIRLPVLELPLIN